MVVYRREVASEIPAEVVSTFKEMVGSVEPPHPTSSERIVGEKDVPKNRKFSIRSYRVGLLGPVHRLHHTRQMRVGAVCL